MRRWHVRLVGQLDEDLPGFDANGEDSQWLGGRTSQHGSRAQVELGTVALALEHVAVDEALAKPRWRVRAQMLQRKDAFGHPTGQHRPQIGGALDGLLEREAAQVTQTPPSGARTGHIGFVQRGIGSHGWANGSGQRNDSERMFRIIVIIIFFAKVSA